MHRVITDTMHITENRHVARTHSRHGTEYNANHNRSLNIDHDVHSPDCSMEQKVAQNRNQKRHLQDVLHLGSQ